MEDHIAMALVDAIRDKDDNADTVVSAILAVCGVVDHAEAIACDTSTIASEIKRLADDVERLTSFITSNK